MKRVWISLAILAAILGSTLAHSHCLSTLTGQLTAQLSQAAAAADQGHWAQAAALTHSARQQWEKRDFYLYVMLRHGCLDEIRTSFTQAQAYLDHRTPWEYRASLAQLITQMELLSEAEQLTVQNIL